MTEVARQPTPALERDRELAHALRYRYVHRGTRVRADHAVDAQAVAALEAAHRRVQPGAEEPGIRLDIANEIARHAQPGARERHPLVAHADRQGRPVGH